MKGRAEWKRPPWKQLVTSRHGPCLAQWAGKPPLSPSLCARLFQCIWVIYVTTLMLNASTGSCHTTIASNGGHYPPVSHSPSTPTSGFKSRVLRGGSHQPPPQHHRRHLHGSFEEKAPMGLVGLVGSGVSTQPPRPDSATLPPSSRPTISDLNIDNFVPPGYDKLMPPKENVEFAGKPTVVRFHVWVLGLDSIDEGSMTYVADIFMSQSWKDNRLVIPANITFNVKASDDPRGPYRLLPLTLIDKIWRPDSFFKNAKEVTFQEMTVPNHYIWLYSDHTILYMVKLSLLLSCAMKFQTYPHDTQNCTMMIESLSYTADDLIFDWEESDPLVVEKHIELPQHDLIHQQIDYCTTNYSSGVFTCVEVMFTLKRRLGYYIFHTYIPTCLIVIMSWISFWIKPEAVPARVTLCVTSLLTLSTQHAQSQKSLPPVSYIKAIDIFMSSCTVFVFASLMEYALVNILMSDELINGWIGLGATPFVGSQSTAPLDPPVSRPASTKPNLPFTCHRSLKDSDARVYRCRVGTKRRRVARPGVFFSPKSTTARPGNFSAQANCHHRRACSSKATRQWARMGQCEEDYASSVSLDSVHQEQHNRKHKSEYLQKKHHRAYVVDNVSRCIFPLSFVLLNTVYWTYYLELIDNFEEVFHDYNLISSS